MAAGMGIVVCDWNAIPSVTAAGASSGGVNQKAQAYPKDEVTGWVGAISDGREALLSRDEDVLLLIGENPADPPAAREVPPFFVPGVMRVRIGERLGLILLGFGCAAAS